ncbi:hypothetical protein Forpe1208_v015442 [Fusarium oxysporum f. sp. rapae]|uniref:Xylanolytic transcriptional activator regulatory domain-containing protein n=1 Tax=Fusarium oxysporum f. sp. rapae TaxID=485398 RepID=A0A8J5NEV1_FUSOX|nr:hypothetical protein Forpe1208_v015442 [Fusarium oxysporum f. sp. rapae]
MSATPSSGGGTFGAATSAHRLSTRVCDNCIRFVDPASTLGTTASDKSPSCSSKVRCDLGQPSCTRCLERGKTCSYSTTRRRPGPTPGSGRQSRAIRNRERRHSEEATVQGGSVSEDTVSLAVAVTDLPSESPETLVTSHAPTQVSNQSSQGPHILPEEEAYLADEYFKSINEAIPLFSTAAVLSSKNILSDCSSELVEALLLITAKLLGFKFASTHFDLDGRIDLILSNTTLQEDTAGDFPSLDLFRKFCLLVFYEFHQFPGQQAWMRIGKIVRLAYWMGLDRLDIIQSVSPEWSNVSYKDLQNWKLVWWCVYRLDSYANLSSGTPYQIDERLVNTSFTHDHYQGLVSPCKLPHDPRSLPDLLLFVKTGSESSLLFNIHLITITVLRQFGRAMTGSVFWKSART